MNAGASQQIIFSIFIKRLHSLFGNKLFCVPARIHLPLLIHILLRFSGTSFDIEKGINQDNKPIESLLREP